MLAPLLEAFAAALICSAGFAAVLWNLAQTTGLNNEGQKRRNPDAIL